MIQYSNPLDLKTFQIMSEQFLSFGLYFGL